MKIIDKTPLLNEKGELGIVQRMQGMLKYGFGWPTELEAQKAIITFFDRQLEKGYTLIRNMTLGASGITVPLILLGPAGIYVIHVSYLRGRYEARANTWNEASGDGYKPASVNLVGQTARMARAVKAFIERQGVKVPVEVEPVLIAGNPGLHIESVRPAIKVIMIDGVKSFVSNLATARPVLTIEAVHEFTERLINPRPTKRQTAARTAAQSAIAQSATADIKTQPPQKKEVSRARAIFNAAEEAKPFNPTDFDFAMADEEPASDVVSPSIQETSPAQLLPEVRPKAQRTLGMSRPQLAVITALAVALLCILAIFGYLIYSTL
jgi:hypothetical protein